ncbi:MAG: hypothetical protein ACPIOQ_42295, partial [Promethearchaeia archaeon]
MLVWEGHVGENVGLMKNTYALRPSLSDLPITAALCASAALPGRKAGGGRAWLITGARHDKML